MTNRFLARASSTRLFFHTESLLGIDKRIWTISRINNGVYQFPSLTRNLKTNNRWKTNPVSQLKYSNVCVLHIQDPSKKMENTVSFYQLMVFITSGFKRCCSSLRLEKVMKVWEVCVTLSVCFFHLYLALYRRKTKCFCITMHILFPIMTWWSYWIIYIKCCRNIYYLNCSFNWWCCFLSLGRIYRRSLPVQCQRWQGAEVAL